MATREREKNARYNAVNFYTREVFFLYSYLYILHNEQCDLNIMYVMRYAKK